MVEPAAEAVGGCGGEEEAPRSSERVATSSESDDGSVPPDALDGHPDWELGPDGAERRDGELFVCLVDRAEVRVYWRAAAHPCSAIVPSVVLEHVLRVQRDLRV